jgi:hypothetical protein
MAAAFALILHELLLIFGNGRLDSGFCMAAGIDGICLMRRHTGNRIGTALRDLEKLLEEATDV